MIPVQNIYHMLAYAFQVLREEGWSRFSGEEFEHTADLLSAILVRGVTAQVKRGLGRAYIEEQNSLSCPKGKIDLSASIKTSALQKCQLVCTYDNFSIDTPMNRILKVTMEHLLRCELPLRRKKELRNLLLYFRAVGSTAVGEIAWRFRYTRNDQTYQMLMNICWLVLHGLLQTEQEGGRKMRTFLDPQRECRLYEKFLLNYFRVHYPDIQVSASQISWALDDDYAVMLPMMQSDIMLKRGGETLIIDAKHYEHIFQTNYEAQTMRSVHLYQIFTYVKNEAAKGGNVSGMLLYAGTDEQFQPDYDYHMSGNRICAKTLRLDRSFSEIQETLDGIVQTFFKGVSRSRGS